MNWNGTPLLSITKEQRGNLSDLKKKGLLKTFKDEGCDWVTFTDEGYKFAVKFEIKVCYIINLLFNRNLKMRKAIKNITDALKESGVRIIFEDRWLIVMKLKIN